MVRCFDGRPVPREVLDRVLRAALRAPSAGWAQGIDLVVLEGPERAALAWEAITTPEWRARSSRWPGLRSAPVAVVPYANRQAYLDRYAEADKQGSGLGSPERWPVPYWLVDTAFATMLLLLAARAEGLGAWLLGAFRGAAKLADALGVPAGHDPIGVLALGWPAPDHPSGSLARGRRPFSEAVHRGSW